MTWQEFETGAYEMATFTEEQFAVTGMALIGTLRRDGSPRISCIDPCIVGGRLYVGMMWQSRKAHDLLRDPRLVIRNAVCTNTGDESEVTLRGRATEVRDPETRAKFVEASGTPWKEPHFHLFSVAVETASLVQYGGGNQTVKLWPEGTEFTRPYG